MVKFAGSIVSLAFLLAFMASQATADTLADIKARGELVVGTKADYPPYGYKSDGGQIIGIEPDLAADLANRLGVKLRLAPVLSANRIQLLQEGKIDLMIATLSITDERKRMVGIIDPPYYAAGIAGFADPKAGIQSEADLKGKSVCAIKGNFFNNDLQSLYVQQDLIIANHVEEAERFLTEGRCVIFVFDETLMLSKKKFEAEKWKDFDLVQFTEVDPLPWGIAVRSGDRTSAYGKFISAAIVDWHRKGFVVDLEKKWLGSNTAWILGVREKYRRQH